MLSEIVLPWCMKEDVPGVSAELSGNFICRKATTYHINPTSCSSPGTSPAAIPLHGQNLTIDYVTVSTVSLQRGFCGDSTLAVWPLFLVLFLVFEPWVPGLFASHISQIGWSGCSRAHSFLQVQGSAPDKQKKTKINRHLKQMYFLGK